MLETAVLTERKDEAGPSVEAENPEDRIKARRNRIAARAQAKKRYLSVVLIFMCSARQKAL